MGCGLLVKAFWQAGNCSLPRSCSPARMNNNMPACGLQTRLSLSFLAVLQRDLARHGQVTGERQTDRLWEISLEPLKNANASLL